MLHILLHRPFLCEGHLASVGLDEQSARDVCVPAALRIYELAKAYREVFTLRRATYLFSYALFSAATILPLHSLTSQSSFAHMDKAIFFWNALKELQNGAHFSLRKPIGIIRGMLERAGIDLNDLPFIQRDDTLDSPNLHTGRDECTKMATGVPSPDTSYNGSYQDFYNDILSESVDWSASFDDLGFPQNNELLYGLFRAGGDAGNIGEDSLCFMPPTNDT